MKKLEIILASGSISRYTTLLQSGIKTTSSHGETLGTYLSRLPGFTQSFIVDDIQTIFLDGTPIDDLETPLINKHSTLALSAAMPGLAGAIFRRNSLHAALRGKKAEHVSNTSTHYSINVTLKLFNAIAAEKGPGLLNNGIEVMANNLLNFMLKRPTLLSTIEEIKVDGNRFISGELLSLLPTLEYCYLSLKEGNADNF